MKNIYANMKISHIIIGFILILFLINFNYYNHIYVKLRYVISKEKTEVVGITKAIRIFISKFNKNQTLLNKIKILENKIMENKYEIGYLKNKNKSRKEIINVFRDIVLKSNVNLVKIELISEQTEKETGKILFKFIGNATLENFISLIDIIENKQEFLMIQNYKLKSIQEGSDNYKVEMILKFVYIIS
jgi:hypothetical protein